MRLDFCVACGQRDPDKLEHHHLVPRSAGGGDEDRNLITMCHDCHGRMHGYQRADIRALTRKGLAAAKARGTKLGGDRGNFAAIADRGRAAGRAARQQRATARAADVRPIIAELQAEGITSLAKLAVTLTERGIPTSRGGERWSPMQVSRVLKAAANGT